MTVKSLRYFLVCFVILLLSDSKVNAQEDRLKALFIYNFTKYVNWPPKDGNFIITVIGNELLNSELQSIASKKTIGNSQIEVKSAKSLNDLSGNCNILYISPGKSDLLPEILVKAKNKNLLIVTEKKDACKNGSCINFINPGGKITFEVSKKNIEDHGLQVNSNLLSLGVSVE